MENKGFNPRSLSLQAGLNATAVRDMLEGRSRFPRYDTIKAIAEALDTSPAFLMGEASVLTDAVAAGVADDLELLTEVISRLQEVTGELNKKLSPRDFAAMATTIYKRIQTSDERKKNIGSIRPQIFDLLDYQALRQKRAGK